MLPVANHLPLRFDNKGNARSRIRARAGEVLTGIYLGLVIAAAVYLAIACL